MATPKLSKSKLARAPSKRAVVYVYCSPEQKRRLVAAAQRTVHGVPGAKMPVHLWLLQRGLAAADAAERCTSCGEPWPSTPDGLCADCAAGQERRP